MIKKNLFIKKFNKSLISIIERIESFFTYYFEFFKKNKKNKKIIDKRIFIAAGSIVILIISYFLTPAFYDKRILKINLEKRILDKYNLEVKLDKPIKYSFFPKPHFYIKDSIISYKESNLAKSNQSNIYISKNFFLTSDSIKVNNIKFKKTEFNITKDNFTFFKNILNANKSNHSLNFSNSKLFYKDQNEDVVFFTKIKNLDLLYNMDFAQELDANFQIFSTLFKLNFVNDLEKRKSFTKLDSHELRLNFENLYDYSEKNNIGLLNLKFINKKKKIEYQISKKFLKFKSDGDILEGTIDLKPFYLTTNLKLDQIDIVKIFKKNSIILNLLNSELLNNQNLNANVNIYSNGIKNVNYLNDVSLNFFFEEGNIFLKDSKISWRDSINVNLDDVNLINNNNNKIIINGAVSFDFIDLNDFYKQYQIKKINRKKIKKVRLDFTLNLDEKSVEIDNLNIDGSSKKIKDNFVTKFNIDKKNIFNKIVFKNIIKDFFENFYDG